VFISETGAAVSDTFADDKAIGRLIVAAVRRRDFAYAALRGFLDSAAFRSLGIQLAGIAGGRAWLDQLLPEQREMLASDIIVFSAGVLDRRLKKVLKAADDIEALDPQSLHQVRLAGKRLRYAAEIFAALYDRKEVQRFQRRLSTVQETLGTFNDGAVTGELMAALTWERGGAERAYAAGVVRGFVAAHGKSARADAMRAWDKFRRVKQFW